MGPISKFAVRAVPQVFDGDAPRKKTWIAETLQKILPRIFTEEKDDDEKADNDKDDKDK